MIPRTLTSHIEQMAQKFPIVSLTGPRQSGKSTLLKNAFPEYQYVSLEDPDSHAFAVDDPKSFLKAYRAKTIIDEAQRVPELFSYLQGIVDSERQPGQYLLSGSQNFLLAGAISQSLAGRVSVQHLLPFSYSELMDTPCAPQTVQEWQIKGGFPRLYDYDIDPGDYYPSYIKTYIERDVRMELGVTKIAEFERFIEACATRIGCLLNVESLAETANVNVKTARNWLSLLEQSFVIQLLRPYHRNFGKRIVKSPKLYFCDTGLACNLLGIENEQNLWQSPYKGPIYECCVVLELIKAFLSTGRTPRLSFWRDSNKNEIDILVENGPDVRYCIEVKASATYRPDSFKVLDAIGDKLGVPTENRIVLYGGDETLMTRHGQVMSLGALASLVNSM